MTTATAEQPQHMQALAKANDIRIKRYRLKRAIGAGRRSVPSVLIDIPHYAETMTVGELLRSQNRWGSGRTRKFCRMLAISENRQLRKLTVRQRALLVAELGR